MKTALGAILIGIIILSFIGGSIGYAEEPQGEEKPSVALPEVPWVTVSGEIAILNISSVPELPWMEVVIKSEEGKLWRLTGSLVKEIRELEGRKVTISGYIGPSHLRYKGEELSRIEVRAIDKVAEEEKVSQ